jgi:hypothetical protein
LAAPGADAQEYVTQVTALADYLDAFPGGIAVRGKEDLTGLFACAGWYLN